MPRRVVAPVCDPVRNGEFSGFKTLSSDLLFVTNDGTLETALIS